MSKEEEIIKIATTIPLEKWSFKKVSGQWDSYVTEINGLELRLWDRSNGAPSLEILGEHFYNRELLIPLIDKIEQSIKNKADRERELKIDEVYNKIVCLK